MTGVVPLAAILSGLILALLVARAFFVMRTERHQRPGSPPGKGVHVLKSEYFSGGGGGGQATEYSIPKDPQDYARLFVPKTNDRKDD